MPQVRLEKSTAERYREAMESRVAVLERIAEQTDATLRDIRSELRDFRIEMRELRQDMHAGLNEVRRVHERDFRLTFGALIATAVGVASLIARSVHWL
jgi:hypothetical protein